MKRPRILVTGANGQLGYELCRILCNLGDVYAGVYEYTSGDYCGLPTLELDLRELSLLARKVRELAPDVIVNAAAYTQVELAESQRALAHRINAEAPAVMAQALGRGGVFLHFSTDYVYNPQHERAVDETDPVDPVNAYAETKLAGDRSLLATDTPSLILRTSWIYGTVGVNFVKTMLRLAGEREELRIVDDQWGAPTHAKTLALASYQILALGQADRASFFAEHAGIYHCADAGATTWFRLACEVFALARAEGLTLTLKDCHPIASHEYPSAARRPLNSRLSLAKLGETFGIYPPDWQVNLKQFVYEYLRSH